ncbi:glycosyltransferase family 4 protein [Sphingomonas sp. NCPPB 2930]|uniref:glycosyltransferase family 4 protein n=1 Tax=unclassified Sphingomonas TaxID=196159 RepID=UPI002860E11D|nr:glycosyltransferase family 1 protein [Sphingomonas sp. SORGH_AS_0870]MDR6144292.1 glycosyltransferase involved in cell wall biosynthesis [Sphingomonas sp. SORGH_AS_0870]
MSADALPNDRRLIAFNLGFLDGTPLTGPGYYAVQLFTELHPIVAARSNRGLLGFVQRCALVHFPAHLHEALHVVDDLPGGRVARVAWEQLRLPLLTRRAGVDLLFSPGFISPMWGSRHYAACIHDMYYAVIPDLIDPRQRRYWQMFIPLTVRRCQRLIAVSTQTRQDLERILPAATGKVRVTKLASRMQPGQAIEPATIVGPYILMVANLTANKNVETILAALQAVRHAGYDLKLVHVGRDPDDRLARWRDDGFAPVVALGKVSDAALAGLYRDAVAVVNASLYEGFGLPAVEAQAMGAPLISSHHPALVEAAGTDGALFYDPKAPDQLASHLMRLLDEPMLRDSLRERGYRNAASMSWGRVARETMTIFDEIV